MPQKCKAGLKSYAWAVGFVAVSSLLAACQAPNLTLNRTTPATLVVAPLREPVEPIPPSKMVEVRANDTLYAVATRYQVTPQSVIEANGLQPPYNLREGQALKLIPRRTHIVRPGDSVYVISQRYAVSQYQLAQLNNLAPPFELKNGQMLQLPNSLDFSVLDVGLPDGVSGTNITVFQQPRANALSRHRWLAVLALPGRCRAKSLLNLGRHNAAFIMMV